MPPTETSLGKLTATIASEQVTPAGVTVAAASAGMGTALCEMCCIHTLEGQRGDDATNSGDKTHRAAEQSGDRSLEAVQSRLKTQRKTLLTLADRDAALVSELFAGDETLSAEMRRQASRVPLAVVEAAVEVLEDAAITIERGRHGVATDARTGAVLVRAALQASAATVRSNLDGDDTEATTDLLDRLAAAERRATTVDLDI
ncbi:MAG: cyclodeaminase/cyclohydrolase family protein [Halobellus sp.]|uniref:cyclodeaminase/cyclohydrolase family protein n=1 Tax=Halobellus sp. TaxID=1979212 RepID=UPI0035D44B9D